MIHAESLCFSVNLEKSELTPSQTFTYLGMTFDTRTMLVTPKRRRLVVLSALLMDLRSQPSATARRLSSLLGMMESLAPLVPLGRLHKRPLQRALSDRWTATSSLWDALIPLGPWFLLTTATWLDEEWLTSGVPICPPPAQSERYTDASLVGWGAHLDNHVASGLWPASMRTWLINRLELEAVHEALKALSPVLRCRTLLVCTDNATVACYINRQGGTHSSLLSQRVEDLLLWCQSLDITLTARRIPGKLNFVADALSRAHMVLHTEWSLTHRTLEPIWREWFRPRVDLFATRFNHRLALYVSPVPDPQAWAVDALSLSWTGLCAYAFPLFLCFRKFCARCD